MKRRLLLPLLFVFATAVQATPVLEPNATDTLPPNKRKTLFAIPLIFFTPETNWGFGAAGIFTWRKEGEPDSLLPSQIQVGGAYTLFNQILSYAPFQLYFNENKYTIYGELGYYRYNYNFYGVGNTTAEQLEENFGVTYPRIRVNALREVTPNLYVGVRHWFDYYTFPSFDTTGLLVTGTVPGSDGGFASGSGLVANYDTRDYYFSPTKGWYMEAGALFFKSFTGSSFSFNKYSLDVSKYYSLPWEHKLVGNFYSEINTGEVPFNMMGLLGGPRRMRGYYEGRYRDKSLMVLQAEYRADIFWRLGLVAFGGMAKVARNVPNLAGNRFHYSAGTGLRIRISDPEKLNLRLDAGVTETGIVNYYVTVREAF